MPAMKLRARSLAGRQRGVTTLIIVALLFFVLSLVAAYTNRNLIFEQRTSANQYRSTQALEAAEAGVEWALSMLNAGRIGDPAVAVAADDSCDSTIDTSKTSFRERYLTISGTTGVVQAAPTVAADGLSGTVWPSCVFDGTNWDCSCPSTGSPVLVQPGSAGVHSAFRVRFVRHTPDRTGLVWLEVNGCTRLDNACLDFPAQAVSGDSRATVRVLIALKSGLPATPSAALTVRGVLDAEGAALGAYNPSTGGSSLAVLTSSTRLNAGNMRLGGAPGAPADAALLVVDDDLPLAMVSTPGLSPEAKSLRMFSNTMLADMATYRDQPASIVLDCGTVTCDADLIRSTAARNPGRILWARGGDVNLGAGADIGSATDPVMLVVDGALNLDATLHGAIYGMPTDWSVTGAGTVRGAMIAGNNMAGGATLTVVRDAPVLALLRLRTGSFVRVPGGWRDF
jgi:hypothetical protein